MKSPQGRTLKQLCMLRQAQKEKQEMVSFGSDYTVLDAIRNVFFCFTSNPRLLQSDRVVPLLVLHADVLVQRLHQGELRAAVRHVQRELHRPLQQRCLLISPANPALLS